MYKKHPMKYKELINIIAHSNGNTKIFLIIIIIQINLNSPSHNYKKIINLLVNLKMIIFYNKFVIQFIKCYKYSPKKINLAIRNTTINYYCIILVIFTLITK